MSLFRNLGLTIALIYGAYHLASRSIPHSLHALNFIQTLVAILALASVIVLVSRHHRSEARFLTNAQEDILIIAASGLFWLAVLVAWRAYRHGGGGSETVGGMIDSALQGSQATRGSGTSRAGGAATGRGRGQSPCSPNAVYCVVEEWSVY